MKLNKIKLVFSKISLITVLMWAVIATPFILGKYCEFNMPAVFDGGAYVYSAENVLRGAEIGVDEYPSARVGTLWMNILGVKIFGFNDIGPKIIQGVLQLAALILMFLGIKKHFGSLAAFISVLVASIYISAPVIAKFGNVKEQFMIASIGIALGSFFLYYGGGKNIWAIVSGAAIAAAPSFKETGVSVTAAMLVFLAASLVLRWEKPKQILRTAALLIGGAAIVLVPMYGWLAVKNIPMPGPYDFVAPYASKAISAVFTRPPLAEEGEEAQQEQQLDYVQRSRQEKGFSEQAPIVLRYYRALIVPIFLASVSLIAAIWRLGVGLFAKKKKYNFAAADKLVFLAAGCWVLDMAFVWISPRSYEEYYIPLTLTGAVAGAYIIWLYARTAMQKTGNAKGLWVTTGSAVIVGVILMSWNVFAGFPRAFHSGQQYGQGIRRRGFAQSFEQIQARKKGAMQPWEVVSEYIYRNSEPDDTIYVWGWYPGMYVRAQRLSCTPRAFTSEMHVHSPQQLASSINRMVADFERAKPLFIVDSRKRHFPWNRPPLELLPSTTNGFLDTDPRIVNAYEMQYYNLLEERFGTDEAKRFEAMSPLRQFIRENYEIVHKNGYRFSQQGMGHPQLGEHVIFRRKNR